MLDPRRIPVRFSRLKRMASSPAHYLASLADVRFEPGDGDEFVIDDDSDTASKRLGRLAHTLVLGGKLLVYPKERRGNAWKEFKAEHAGEDIVTAKEYARAVRMAAALASHSDAMALLEGERELEISWTRLGRECLSHLDVLGDRFVTDLKTSTITAPGWFCRQAVRMHYHAQLAWYVEAARFLGRPCSTAYIVAVETAPPYVVTPFELTRRALEAGEKQCHLWLERLLACEEAAAWPGYVQSVVELDVPEIEPEFIYDDGEAA